MGAFRMLPQDRGDWFAVAHSALAAAVLGMYVKEQIFLANHPGFIRFEAPYHLIAASLAFALLFLGPVLDEDQIAQQRLGKVLSIVMLVVNLGTASSPISY